MSKSGFVPNSFQTPNAYVDQFMSFLTGEECKVLIYATRRILGFQKRQDRISISQFTDGLKNKDGESLDLGTGLSIDTVKKCLSSLVAFGLMVRLDENDPRTNEGVLWSLQWDEDKVDWKALEEREEQKSKTNAERIAKARSVRQTHPPSDRPTSVTQNAPPLVAQTHPSPCGTETQKTEETQGNKEDKDSCLEILQGFALSVFPEYMTWHKMKLRLQENRIGITGDRQKLVISGLSGKVGQFTEAEVWEEKYSKSFANIGLELTFTE